MKTFLVDHEGNTYLSPQFLKRELAELRWASRRLSSKQQDSNNRRRARLDLARKHEKIKHKRRDAHFKLAHQLLDRFDVLVFEDLNLKAMQRLWGRKVSDLGFADFVSILEYVATKRGKQVVKINRFEPTSGVCSECGQRQQMPLRERTYRCGNCGLVLDRDHNAAKNVFRVGVSTLGLEGIRLPPACAFGADRSWGAALA